MELLEWSAVGLGLIYLILIIRERRVGWIAGALASAIFLFVFWDAQLPGQALLQIYYVAIAVRGWLHWGNDSDLSVTRLSSSQHLAALALLVVASVLTIILRDSSTDITAAADALTSWGGVIATWMVAQKKVEAWVWWIVIDAATVALYISAGLIASSALYLIYTGLAVFGLWQWYRTFQQSSAQN
jgi:nicotinamide mononucleotide transporter